MVRLSCVLSRPRLAGRSLPQPDTISFVRLELGRALVLTGNAESAHGIGWGRPFAYPVYVQSRT
eukprot:2905708-Pyramimonas_sp.AAC.1